MRADIVPGAIFPDYELTGHTKTRRRLSELQGIDPMTLVLSGGHERGPSAAEAPSAAAGPGGA